VTELVDFAFADFAPFSDGEIAVRVARRVDADPEREWVPAYHCEIVLVGPDWVIGQLDLRIGDGYRLETFSGHVGYRVQPAWRGRRFAARACRLAAPIPRHHGMRELWITCDPENRASRRTCELLGARYVETVDVPPDLDIYRQGSRRKCRYLWKIA